MTDQKHTKEIMVSSPNRYGKNFQSLNESIARANEGKIVLCTSNTGEAIMISRGKYESILSQRDELRKALLLANAHLLLLPNSTVLDIDRKVIKSALTKTEESV